MFTSKLPTQAFGIPKADNFLEAPTKFWLHSLIGFMCPLGTLRGQGSTRFWIATGLLFGALGSCQRPESPPGPIDGSSLPGQSRTIATLTRPTAAALSTDGKTVYVLAQDETSAYQIYSGSVGSALSVVRTSQPLSYPVAIAVNRAGSQLYVLDLAESGSAHPAGAIYRVTQNGEVSVLPESTPSHPTGIALSHDDQQLYIVGTDGESPVDRAGVWRAPVAGGTTVAEFTGSPLSQPLGVAVASDGAIYVADAQGSSMGTGGIFRVSGGKAFPLSTTPLRLTYPAGLCAAGRVSADVLFTSPSVDAVDPWLTRLSPDGRQEAVELSPVNEATALYRAADADLWVAVEAAVPEVTATPDPDQPDQPQGRILLLSP